MKTDGRWEFPTQRTVGSVHGWSIICLIGCAALSGQSIEVARLRSFVTNERYELTVPKGFGEWFLSKSANDSAYGFRDIPITQKQGTKPICGESNIPYYNSGTKALAVSITDSSEDGDVLFELDDGRKGFVPRALVVLTSEQQESFSKRYLENLRRETEELKKHIASMRIVSNNGRSVFLASDQKCLAQYLAAIKRDGIEARKRLAELIAYSCGVIADPFGASLVRSSGSMSFVQLDGEAIVRLERFNGWVLSSWLHQIPKE